MAEVLRMPRMSDTMEEGNIVAWLKKEGDKIEAGDVIAEVETDKATMELESYQEGYLLYIGIKEGAVPVNGLIAIIGEKGEDYKTILKEEEIKGQKEKEASDKTQEVIEVERKKDDDKVIKQVAQKPLKKVSYTSTSDDGDNRLKASPLAKKMAKEPKVNLSEISGTGDNGRITKTDVEHYLKYPRTKASKPKKEKIIIDPPVDTVYGDVDLSQMRKVIARRLGESKFSAPHFYLTIEIEMSSCMETRKSINLISKTRISFNDMIIRACAMALKAHPAVNASWMDSFIRYNETVNIGVAVAVSEGLLVPVLNDTDSMTLAEINNNVKQLAKKAKAKKLQPDEMQGNTFTISNLGMFGIDEFTAIINPPDACILAVGGIAEKPVIVNNKIVPGNIMKVTLSCDHRVVDGATGAQFLQTVKQLLENPVTLLYLEE